MNCCWHQAPGSSSYCWLLLLLLVHILNLVYMRSSKCSCGLAALLNQLVYSWLPACSRSEASHARSAYHSTIAARCMHAWSKAAIQRRSSMPEEPCPGQTCVPARVRMPVELMTAAGVGAGDSAGAGDGAGTGGERGAGGAAAGGQAAPPPAELAAALWSLANGLLHYSRDLLRVAIPLPHPVTDAAALHLVLWLATALAVLPWRWRAIEAAGTADADQLRRLEWAAAIALCTCVRGRGERGRPPTQAQAVL